ncbi:hypothetical protein ACS8E2_09645 [Psychrobacter glaciei]|uniref:hypothetical protein n=1 Tax=Psychrobacter glaciei TaxID=619771 RepID=UPI003F46F22E
MNNEQIKEIALENGHALFTMPDGTEDIHPHVYKFSRELLKVQNERIRVSLQNLSNEIDNTNDRRVIGYCLDWVQEFIDEITVIENEEEDNE